MAETFVFRPYERPKQLGGKQRKQLRAKNRSVKMSIGANT